IPKQNGPGPWRRTWSLGPARSRSHGHGSSPPCQRFDLFHSRCQSTAKSGEHISTFLCDTPRVGCGVHGPSITPLAEELPVVTRNEKHFVRIRGLSVLSY